LLVANTEDVRVASSLVPLCCCCRRLTSSRLAGCYLQREQSCQLTCSSRKPAHPSTTTSLGCKENEEEEEEEEGGGGGGKRKEKPEGKNTLVGTSSKAAIMPQLSSFGWYLPTTYSFFLSFFLSRYPSFDVVLYSLLFSFYFHSFFLNCRRL
jgi:hypothetical protein